MSSAGSLRQNAKHNVSCTSHRIRTNSEHAVSASVAHLFSCRRLPFGRNMAASSNEHRSMWSIRYFLIVAISLVSCTDGKMGTNVPSGTLIPASAFKFADVVSAPKNKPGGWRAVCIHARAGQTLKTPNMWDVDSSVVCRIEVGVPIHNDNQGFIPREDAQEVAAMVANESAYAVLLTRKGISSSICREIITTMNIALKEIIEGSRVNQCGTTRYRKTVPVVRWP